MISLPSCCAAVAVLTISAAAVARVTDGDAQHSCPAAHVELVDRYDIDFDQPALAAVEDSDAWRFDFTAWIWLMGMEGDVVVGDLTSEVSASFLDTLEASDSLFALSGRLEIGKGKWGGFVDGMYANIGVEDQSGPLGVASIDITFEMILIDFGVMYRLAEWEPTGNGAASSHDASFDLYGGGRYTNLDMELDPDVLPERQGDVEWIDPIVGAKLVLPLSEQWHIMAMGDIGGFGVESDFTWHATAVLGFDFTLFEKPSTLYLGYRAIGQDYSEGSGENQFTWDVILHGPLLGFAMNF